MAEGWSLTLDRTLLDTLVAGLSAYIGPSAGQQLELMVLRLATSPQSPVEPASDHLRGRTPASLAQAAHEAASRLEWQLDTETHPIERVVDTEDIRALVDHVLHTSDYGRARQP